MPFGGSTSERILILAPYGRDAAVASKLLQEAGWSTLVCLDVARLAEEVTNGAGCAVVVEEVIASNDISPLAASITAQPPWSDVPMVVLTARADVPERNVAALRLQDALGNVTFVERPFHPTTLVNVVRAAVRSRRRQYGAREVLERMDLVDTGVATSHQEPPCSHTSHRLRQPARKAREGGIHSTAACSGQSTRFDH